MTFSKMQKMILIVGTLIIYALAWKMQSQFLIKGDVSWQMYLARVVLHGGNYVKNFFEINPPLSIFLYMPTIMIGKLFSVSHIISVRIYFFLLSLLSLCICTGLVKKIFEQKNSANGLIFILFLSLIDLILPLGEFGQRENFLMIFTMPYFLLSVCRVDDKNISTRYAIFLGLFSAFGFLLKPFFLAALILVEAYVYFSKKKFFIWRPETITLVICGIVYVALVFIFFNSYLTVVVPMAMQFYYQKFFSPWHEVLFSPLVIFSCLSIAVYFFQGKKAWCDAFSTVLLLAFLGFLFSFLMQNLAWYYHFFPAFSMALLLTVYLFSMFIQNARAHFFNAVAIGIIAFIFFSLPSLYVLSSYQQNVSAKKILTPLIVYLRTHEFHRPVYFFSAYTAYMVSVFEEAECQHASRLQFLAWMRGDFGKNYFQKMSSSEKHVNLFFSTMLAADLNHYKPDLIFVDNERYALYRHQAERVDYLNMLKKSKVFQAAWKQYFFLKTIQENGAYDFAIYARKSSTHR